MFTTIQFRILLVATTKERTPGASSQGNQGLSRVLSVSLGNEKMEQKDRKCNSEKKKHSISKII